MDNEIDEGDGCSTNEDPVTAEKDDDEPSTQSEEEFDEGREIQLIRILQNQDETNKCSHLYLEKGNLNTLLESTENRLMCVISVLGPPEKLKTLLLNRIKLALEALERGDKTFQVSNLEPDAAGFQNHSQTNGVFAWSRAFLIDTALSEIAVILLDTHGLDLASSHKEISSIFCLTSLISSITVYNLSDDLTTKDIDPLIIFLKYGALSKDYDVDCCDEPPFQKLSFLIWNWQFSKYNYGKDGGKLLLRNRLKMLKGEINSQPLKTFRILFKNVEAFLMPPTVIPSQQQPGYEGHSEFVFQLNHYIINLLKEENLFVKKILGVNVRSFDFFKFLEIYVDTFNSFLLKDATITEIAILDASCDTLHSNILSKALKKYVDVFQKTLKHFNYLPDDYFQSAHERGKVQASLLYEQSKTLLGYEDEYKMKLDNQLKEAYETARTKNEEKRSRFITECIRKTDEHYRSVLNAKLRTFDITPVYDDDVIKDVSEAAREECTKLFMANFQKESKEIQLNLSRSLHEIFLTILTQINEENIAKIKQISEILGSKCADALRVYEGKITVIMSVNPFAETDVLRIFHEELTEEAIKVLDDSTLTAPSQEIQKYKLSLASQLEQEFQSRIIELKKSVDKKLAQADAVLERQFNNYQSELGTFLANCKSEEVLKRFHEEVVNSLVKKFNEVSPFPPETSHNKELITKLQGYLDMKFEVIQNEYKTQNIKAEMNKCVQDYTSRFAISIQDTEFMPKEDIENLHTKYYNQAISDFTRLTDSRSEHAAQHRMQLISVLESHWKKINSQNNNALDLITSKTKNCMADCLKKYQKLMHGPSNNCERKEDFRRTHENFKNEIQQVFKNEWTYRNKTLLKIYLDELETELEETFAELLVIFEVRKRSDDDRTAVVKQTARKFYYDQMEKKIENNRHMKQSALLSLHKESKKAALNHCTQKFPLKETQVTSLKAALEKSFKHFCEKNDMILNWASGAEPAIGIDLGTTYCCVAVHFKGKTVVIRNIEGRNTTPSYVSFNENGSHTIGRTAKNNAFSNPENTIFDSKRIIGRNMEDQSLINDIKFWPFNVINTTEGPVMEVFNKSYPPELIAALLLKKLAAQASLILEIPVKKAVITVPAYFTDGQRAATFDAGEIAGLDVLQIMDEPTAAAVAYKLERFNVDARRVLIFDFGGGTFDVSVLEMDGTTIIILSKDGDTHLGGEDIDKAMMEYCVNSFKTQHGVDPFQGKDSAIKQEKDAAKQRLRRLQSYCEKGKLDLGTAMDTTIIVDSFMNGIDLKIKITRETFEELNHNIFQKTIDILNRLLTNIKLSPHEIDDIVLVGGSSRIPKIQNLLSEYFNGKALSHTVHPDEAVAYGAAVQAALLNGQGTNEGFEFASIRDVTPMSLGVEAVIGGKFGEFSIIIPKNTSIPTRRTETFRTYRDNQRAASIKIYQGEFPDAKSNKFLGQFDLNDIPAAKAGMEAIEVIMEINTMGILHVTGVCKSTKGQKGLSVKEQRAGRLDRCTKIRLMQEIY